MTASKATAWKRPYLAPRVDRAQRKTVEGKSYIVAVESAGAFGGPNYGPS